LRHSVVSILPLESILSRGLYASYKERTSQIFGSVRCWVNHVRRCLAYDMEISLNWKMKISNTTDNADITQPQTRDYRYRRMQELNSLCISK